MREPKAQEGRAWGNTKAGGRAKEEAPTGERGWERAHIGPALVLHGSLPENEEPNPQTLRTEPHCWSLVSSFEEEVPDKMR